MELDEEEKQRRKKILEYYNKIGLCCDICEKPFTTYEGIVESQYINNKTETYILRYRHYECLLKHPDKLELGKHLRE